MLTSSSPLSAPVGTGCIGRQVDPVLALDLVELDFQLAHLPEAKV
jgi:hypothetical protein